MHNWIVNKWFDWAFILGPQFVGLLCLLLFPGWFSQFNENIPVAAWVVLIMCIDVSHVYSTLFRTYFDKNALKKNRDLLLLIPFGSLVAGIITYQVSPLLFWRLLAYTAVFHFIRQQYGFLRLYLRKTSLPTWSNTVDTVCIYAFTGLPILIWHFTGLKNFNWFVENDFLYVESTLLKEVFTFLFYFLFGGFILKELFLLVFKGQFSMPKTMFLTGTALSWFVGIVILNGDLSFTFLNVVSHGIPYIALIWYYGNKNYVGKPEYNLLQLFFSPVGIMLMLAVLITISYVEEGLWDGLIWHEHLQVFGFFNGLPSLTESAFTPLIIPLLTLPQLTHYILDGFIWKIGDGDFYWKK